MIQFVIAETNLKIEKQLKDTIDAVMNQSAFSFEISFVHTREELLPYIKNKHRKIYIIDYLEDANRVDIARLIRDDYMDWSSFLIILSMHSEYLYSMMTMRLLLFDYILLYDNAMQKLSYDLKRILEIEREKNFLVLEERGLIYRILFDDILYITTDIVSRKSMIVTAENTFFSGVPLYKIKSSLPFNFLQVQRSYIVNMKEISFVNFRKNEIYFKHSDEKVWFSRRYAKNVKERIIEDCKN